MRAKLKNAVVGSTSLLVLCLLSGCSDPNSAIEEPSAGVVKKIEAIQPAAAAGIDKSVSKSMSPDRMKGLIASTASYGHRDNPFALNSDERKFDDLQASERFLSEQGHFSNSFELPEDKDDAVVVEEAQPYRRISGIVIGDAIYAILEENGRSTIIRPGSTIPDTEWVVVSINRDEVKLRRSGKTLPNEVTVRLEVAPPGIGGGGAPAGGGNGGLAGMGGAPGGPGGGPRGGPSGGNAAN